MTYTIFMIPLLIIFVGFLMFKKPPKKINWLIGYRTKKSMNNKNTWIFAHKYCGRLWIKIGLIMLIISGLLYVLLCFKLLILTEITISIVVLSQVIVMALSIFIVESKVKSYK